jgi:hypothetical protein
MVYVARKSVRPKLFARGGIKDILVTNQITDSIKDQ